MKVVDTYLNKITMYRLTLYVLIVLTILASIVGFFGYLPYSGFDILFSTFVTVVVCYIANLVFAKIFKAVTNIESVFITALIIVLIFPSKFPVNFLPLIGVSLLAMGSKYLLTIEKRHLFNPAAISVLMLSFLSPEHSATWWVGTPSMIIPVTVCGLLLLRRIRRSSQVVSFLITFMILSGFASITHTGSVLSLVTIWQRSLFSSAVLFFSFIMLTEPLTSPPTKKLQNIYGILVGVIYATPLLRISGFIFTPEEALIAGNLFSYIVSPKYRLILPLLKKIKLSTDSYLFVFKKIPKFNFTPGQYMEWTLPHPQTDSRGNRRYFSIASAPHENLMINVKFYEPSSSYKKALLSLEEGNEIIAASLSGDFVLPKNNKFPLVFIAGGVGIAPFRSILEDIISKGKQVDIVVIYANKTRNDILFYDTLENARKHGVRTTYILTDKNNATATGWTGYIGHVTDKMIKTEIPDFNTRKFYISGPQLMVQNFEQLLLKMRIKGKNIKVDFFPGYTET